jgi:hypothetical protein
MNSGYFPVVLNPAMPRPQIKSEEYKPIFYFGGSQIPNALSVSKGSGIMKNDVEFSTKRGNKIFHKDGKLVKMFGREAFKKSGIY